MNQAIVAAVRFGYGIGPDVPAPKGDVRGWLTAQLSDTRIPASFDGLPDAAAALIAYEEDRERRKLAAQAAAEGKVEVPDPAADKVRRDAFLAEVNARYAAAISGEAPFRERLVAFWANHFTVSGVRGDVKTLAGPFEREAIRPHVGGSFADMVLAVVRHPAMQLYLDNAASFGPDSPAGLKQHRGVNENLGRELLELHTLGVDGGYTEEDVRALARILTGWTVGHMKDPQPGRFRYIEARHEPGPKQLLGRLYPDDGEGQGEAAIRDIAGHPATARHVARQLARHFISDKPPPEAIERLARSFVASGGDLRAVGATLVAMPEVWNCYQQKIKTPWDLVVSASIATGIRLPPDQVANALQAMGQPVFMAPQPSGWPDDGASWAGPEQVMRRVEWCAGLARHADPTVDPVQLADLALGDTLDHDARQTIARAESRQSAIALLLASPAFQRR